MRVTVVGTGYVGLVTGMCLAQLGHSVAFLDRDEILIGKLRRGILPIYEPGLDQLIEANRAAGRIGFHSDARPALADAELVFLCVGTPMGASDGQADLTALFGAVADLAPHLRDRTTIVLKSTVPVGTNARVAERLAELRPDIATPVASNPEFLREGTAVADFLYADRVVCGVNDDLSRERLIELYGSGDGEGFRLVMTSPENAELSKYASNAFLAAKVTFINEMADLCERVGADIGSVAAIMGMDTRIGADFLQAGPGYGGSCFPKDTAALAAAARAAGTRAQLTEATIRANAERKIAIADRIAAALQARDLPRRVAVLGVTFKAQTDDVRDSPALDIVARLQDAGIAVAVHDPVGLENAKRLLHGVTWAADALEAARGAGAVVLLTDWPQFRALDLAALRTAMAGPFLFDMRNAIDAEAAGAAGLDLIGVGTGARRAARGFELVRARAPALSRVL